MKQPQMSVAYLSVSLLISTALGLALATFILHRTISRPVRFMLEASSAMWSEEMRKM